MLLETFPNAGERDALREVLERRLRYLVSRAEAAGKRTPDASTPAWQPRLAEATLWMEAVESAVALGSFGEARRHLRRAVEQLLRLQLPLGAALQQTFLSQDDQLGQLARNVLERWQAELWQPTRNSRKDIEPTTSTLARAALETPQQWAYLALAEADVESVRSAAFYRRLSTVSAVPVGRLRLTLDDYRAVVEAPARVGARLEALLGRPIRRELTPVEEAARVIAKSLEGLYRSLQAASANAYLWQRLLAPAPMFDLDTALLVARLQQTKGLLKLQMSLILDLARESIAADARPYAEAFIAAVDELKSDPLPLDPR